MRPESGHLLRRDETYLRELLQSGKSLSKEIPQMRIYWCIVLIFVLGGIHVLGRSRLGTKMADDIGLPEWVTSKQKQFQAVHKLTHLKGPHDRVTSVIIPGVLLASCFTLVV